MPQTDAAILADDERWMRRAVQVGAAGTRAVRPNPRVGCVLVQGGAEIASGFHAVCGGPHAEVVALAVAGQRAVGATAYVTLEPCNHHGRTGPCVQALLRAGVARVVYGAADPHPQAQGGAAALRQAGVAVAGPVLNGECRQLAEVFFANVAQGRPFVQLKLAATLDGRIAAADGTSRWISGPDSRAQVARMRQEADAILIGSSTALHDNPRLDLRALGQPDAGPLRVIADRRGRMAGADPALLHLGDGRPTLICTANAGADWQAWRDRGAEVAAFAGDHRWLAQVLADLLRRGVHHLLCEGGGQLAAALVGAGCVDRIDWCAAPKILGSGVPAIGPLGIGTMAEAVPWRWCTAEMAGGDVWLTARPAQEAPCSPG